MSNQIVISSGAKLRNLNGVITGTTGVLDSVPLGGANGVATLDSSGKVPVSQLPSSVVTYLGTWNAATNTPTLANGTGDAGDMYLCNVAGTVNFGAGPITFAVGDWVLYGSGTWQKSNGQNGTVTSVAVTESGDALTITGSPITTAGTINIGFAGTSAQYVAGDGSLITFPSVITEAQNLITEVYNETGATLTKGTVVYINGGHGNLPTVTKAIATGDSTSAQTYGVIQTDIGNNNNGYVVVIGSLSDLDTQAYTAGTQLYLSSTTAGAWTSTKQYAPAHLVYVGIVVRSHPTQGVVEIRIQNGFELDELHNVSAQTPSNNDGIFYNSSNSLWEAKSIATALGYTPANAALVVPYTGATTSLNMGSNSISSTYYSSQGDGTNAGSVILKQRFAASGAPSGYSSISAFGDTTFLFSLNDGTTNRKFYFSSYLLGSTSRTYILPNADGTLALTTDLGSYLPLSGGTLTGALNGTTATFSYDNNNLSLNNPSGNYSTINFKNGGTTKAQIYYENSTNKLWVSDYLNILYSTGAATFSSSVTVNGDSSIFNGGTANNFNTYALGIANTKYLVFASTAAAQAGGRNWSGGIGADSSENVFLGSYNNLTFGAGTLATRMTILGSNGNVGIGTSSPQRKFVVSNGGADGIELGNEGTSGSIIAYNRSGGYYIPLTIQNGGGNVLVGTSTDNGNKFQVNGSSSFFGNIDIGNGYMNFSYSDQGIKMSKYNVGEKQALWASSQQYLFLGTTETNSWERVYAIATSGGVYLTNGSTSWTANSDERLKNITSNIDNALSSLSNLRTVKYSWKSDELNRQYLGLIAQDVQKVFPEIVDIEENEEKTLGVRYTELIPVLIAAIQEQQKQIEELKAKIK